MVLLVCLVYVWFLAWFYVDASQQSHHCFLKLLFLKPAAVKQQFSIATYNR